MNIARMSVLMKDGEGELEVAELVMGVGQNGYCKINLCRINPEALPKLTGCSRYVVWLSHPDLTNPVKRGLEGELVGLANACNLSCGSPKHSLEDLRTRLSPPFYGSEVREH